MGVTAKMTKVLSSLPFFVFNFFDTIYQGTLLTAGLVPGIVPGVVAFFVNLFAPLWCRWLVTLLMLLTTAQAVTGSAHDYADYLLGCAVYVLLTVAGLYARTRRTSTGILKLHPYDLLVFVIGVVLLSLMYEAPLM